jgi:hypothetical protein
LLIPNYHVRGEAEAKVQPEQYRNQAMALDGVLPVAKDRVAGPSMDT